MANGAGRIFKIMQKTNVDTVSEVVYLTVKSTSPLILNLENRFDITSDFYILNDEIVPSKISVGDKLLAFTFNDGQCYFIQQAIGKDIKKTADLEKVIKELQGGV